MYYGDGMVWSLRNSPGVLCKGFVMKKLLRSRRAAVALGASVVVLVGSAVAETCPTSFPDNLLCQLFGTPEFCNQCDV